MSAADRRRQARATSKTERSPARSPSTAIRQLVRYAQSGPPARELSRAFAEFFGPQGPEPRQVEGSGGAIFIEWFLFDRQMTTGETPARLYALASPSLSAGERRAFFTLADTVPGFFEVVGFDGGGMWLLPFPDPSGRRAGEAGGQAALWVDEAEAARRLSRGDVIWTRLLFWRGRWHLATCCFVLPPSARELLSPLIQLRPRYSERAWRRLMGELQPQLFRDLMGESWESEAPICPKDYIPLEPVEVQTYLERAQRLLDEEEDLKEALRLYWRVLADNPLHEAARLGVARIRWRQGRMAAAERAVRSVLATSPRHPEALEVLGLLLWQRGAAREAEMALKSYVRVAGSSASVQALVGLGQIALESGRTAHARRLFAQAESAARRQYAPRGTGPRRARRGHRGADKGDTYGQVLVNIGWELAESRRWKEAILYFTRCTARARSREVRATAWHGLGEALSRLGRHLDAAGAYLQALRTGVAQPKLWAEVGRCYLRAHRLAEAEQAYRTSVQRLPGYVKGLVGLATVQLRRGRIEQATTAARRAVHIAPDNARALAVLGAIWLRRGHPARARTLLARALAADPKDVNARRLYQMALARCPERQARSAGE